MMTDVWEVWTLKKVNFVWNEKLWRCLVEVYQRKASTSETLVNFYQTTRRYNPEDSHLHTHRRESLKSYMKHYDHRMKYMTTTYIFGSMMTYIFEIQQDALDTEWTLCNNPTI
jgi:hypothetical protein